ncbi:ribosome biogenesis/translation initiation ATPase RLI [Candidatus Micrarchaeota archaeon CG10_big_fil_rev_8_21_14_0_10_59_7]|nr:MAG: ribosome biogenesis/translation initiation ATPase RLI [Candidatus Micrarchaeota archaeon CG10_big_fil_rev_8_21_14_0_10_59_7]
MRIAVLDRGKCKFGTCGYACIKVCPGVKMREETIVQGRDGHPVISEELCSGCGLCAKKCPFGAIKIVNLPGESGKPFFQYGVNTFRLYGYLLPKERSVVGVVGVNAIGKTTALEILRGALRPNFGSYSKKLSWDEIKEAVRGQEIVNYLQALEETRFRVAHKMQYVEALAKSRKTLGEALEEVDESNGAERIASELELTASLSRKLSELSGGELQRTAIACTMLRDADAYFFDELSSYLDVRQRLLVAKRIRALAEEKSVVVVEHDLALLDYLSDYVQVLYGVRGVYGKISALKGTRVGINEFLEGFLRDENVRFRDYAIKFDVKGASEGRKGAVALAYNGVRKHYPAFSLAVDAGKIYEGEVLGVLGPNAIGKSTFVKMLAGVEKPDEGETGAEKKKVAYKPQYLKSAFEGTVRQLLAQSNVDAASFEEVKHRLDILDLMDKDVAHLSGGELQRLSIALCLCTKADIYLLDEPSAFLDVEQRLNVAHLVRKTRDSEDKPAFVVDHDILFIDSVSDRLVVFEGAPAKEGRASPPKDMREGMHSFLRGMGVTFRRDLETGRPRANKPGSQTDEEQKASGNYYYA